MQIYREVDKGAGGPPAEPPVEPPEDDVKKKSDPIPETVPYGRFKKINDQYLEAAEQVKTLTEADEKRVAQDAKKQGKFEELWNDEKSKRASAELGLLRNEVATEKGLPQAYADRLRGDDREALVKDADAFLEMIEDSKKGNKGIPDITDRRAASEVLDLANMTPKEIRENAARLHSQTTR